MKKQKSPGQKLAKHETVTPGFVLLNNSLRPVFWNDVAAELARYPDGSRRPRNAQDFLVETLCPVLAERGLVSNGSTSFEVVSGRRHYLCRAFALNGSAGHKETSPFHPAIALLLERRTPCALDLSWIAAEAHLSPREQEAVGYLAQGLTSKEIAARMNITSNTVKAFLRLVMLKMGVTTRSGILGRIIEAQVASKTSRSSQPRGAG